MKFGKNVKELSEKDFENFKIKKNDKNGIVVFYATWCGFCQALVPEYKKLAKNKKINVYAIDVDKNQKLTQYFGVQSFPTIKRVNKFGKLGIKYNGDRNANDMLSFVLNQTGGKKLKQCKGKTKKNIRCKRKTKYSYCSLHK